MDTNNSASRFDRVVDVDAAHGVHMEGAQHFLTEQLCHGLHLNKLHGDLNLVGKMVRKWLL